jgi:phosphoribosylformylglycinamidine synthase subunit PurS
MLWEVEVVLENKKAARDPVGETIKRDLLAKKGYNTISQVRSGQYLRINIESSSQEQAKNTVEKMCNDLRIFNPVTQTLTILNVKQS